MEDDSEDQGLLVGDLVSPSSEGLTFSSLKEDEIKKSVVFSDK